MRSTFLIVATLVAWSLAGCSQDADTSVGPVDLSATGPASQSADRIKTLIQSIDEIVAEYMDSEHLPGVAVVIVKEGRTIYQQGYGFAHQPDQTPVNPEATIFRIGSISKSLTALAMMRLVEEGRIGLDDEVAPYTRALGEIPNMSGSDEPVRIWHLLTHTAGFDQIGVNRFDQDLGKDVDVRLAERPTLAEFLSGNNLRRTIPPGLHYRYDTYGITLAGHILEQVTGKPYAEAMDELLFGPAGMQSSFVGVDPRSRPRLARGHGWLEDGFAIAGYEIYYTQPASSVDATPADIAKLMQVLTGSGVTANGEKVFAEDTVAKLLAPQYRPHMDFPGVAYGFNDLGGFETAKGRVARELSHGGTMFGFQSSLSVFPVSKVAVFVTANRNFETGGGPVRLHGVINDLVRSTFTKSPATIRHDIPSFDITRDLKKFAGTYYFDLYCHTCTEAEFEARAWRRGDPVEVVAREGTLRFRDKTYLPTREDGVFVSDDGERKVYFKSLTPDGLMSFSWINSQEAFIRTAP